MLLASSSINRIGCLNLPCFTAVVNALLALISFTSQCRLLYLSSGYASVYDRTYFGVFDSIVFLYASVSVWQWTSSSSILTIGSGRICLLGTLCTSSLVGVLQVCLSWEGWTAYVLLCPLQTFYGPYDCSTEMNLEILLLCSGLVAFLVNALLAGIILVRPAAPNHHKTITNDA